MTLLNSSFIKNLSSTIISNLLSIVMSIAISALLSRILGVADKGRYEIIITTILLLDTLLGLSISSAITYLVASNKFDSKLTIKYLIIIPFIQGIITIIFVILLLKGANLNIINNFIPADNYQETTLLAILIASTVTIFSIGNYCRSAIIGEQEIVYVNNSDIAIKIIHCIILAIVAFVSIVFFSRYVSPVFVTIGVFSLTKIVGAFLYCKRVLLLKNDRQKNINTTFKNVLWSTFAFSLPVYFANLIQFLNYKADVFIVNLSAGSREVGIYTLAVYVSQLLWVVSSAIASVILPSVSASLKTANIGLEIAKVSRILLAVNILMGTALCLCSTMFLPIVFGRDFSASINIIYQLMPGIVLFSVTNVLAAYFAGTGLTHINLISSIIGLFITISLDLSLIPIFKSQGAAIASTISYSVTTAVTIYLFTRETKIKLSKVLFLSRQDIKEVQKKITSYTYRFTK
jgi:O-antigen/teichoic acid export membrane protein